MDFISIALGAYDLYNVTGWLSDVLSYSRLLALGLATGVIAQVVNQMGSMGGKNVFGVILFVIVFIMDASLRSTYSARMCTQIVYSMLESFGKFLWSGGRAFHPLEKIQSMRMLRRDQKLWINSVLHFLEQH